MDFLDLKNKGIKELHELLSQKRNQLRELRFKVSEKQLKNVKEVKKVKITIAQILTLINANNKKEVKQ
ncbi:50S ribosomal protein L29 [Patescibacteria group bacterium]|nr:50S ribosomal protein L29 [Patescibacteria group bacterium]